ncbi:hypothetical protein JW998_07045 [candidate division KSB1 bacterium]|nr:hypothetical protein [candidate division KSB1 bacterium]
MQDHHTSGNKPLIFDGVHIPFKEAAFYSALGSFMLHHAPFQKELLADMKRVIQARMFMLLHRLTARINYRSKRMQSRRSRDWRALFAELGLSIVKEIRIKRSREFFYPVSRRLFVLSKDATLG